VQWSSNLSVICDIIILANQFLCVIGQSKRKAQLKRSGLNRTAKPRISSLAEYVHRLGDKTMPKETQRKLLMAHHSKWITVSYEELMKMVKAFNPRENN
jgi:hypothetical protein